jgi:glycosyltransferase 2 family protein
VTRRTKFLLKLGVTLVALAAALWNVGGSAILEKFGLLDATAWTIAFVGFVVVHGCGTLKWRFFVRLSGARLGLRDGFRCYSAGLFANLCLPSVIGGDVLRAGLAMAATRQKTAVVLGSVVDRAADFTSLAALAVLGFIAAWGPASRRLASQAGGTNWTPLLVACGCGVLVLAAVVVGWKIWRPRGRVHKILMELLVALRRLRRHALLAICGFALSMALQLTLLLVQRELGIRMGMPREFAIWLFIWPTAKLVAMIPISISGLGVRENAWRELAKPFGITAGDAVSTSLAFQVVVILGGLIGGAVWLLLTWRPGIRLARPERQPT